MQAAPKDELLLRPASEAVARLVGVRNILRGTVAKASPDRVEIAWRGATVEAVNSLAHPYQAPAGTPVAFFVRPEHVRLIRKDRPAPDAGHHMNVLERRRSSASSTRAPTWTLLFRLDGPGPAGARAPYDLEIELPKLVYEMLDMAATGAGRCRCTGARCRCCPRHERRPRRLPVLVAEGVHVAYGGRPVLDVAAFAVHEGEVLAVIGPNGAGKSTLLRVLALLETPVRGTVPSAAWSRARRATGWRSGAGWPRSSRSRSSATRASPPTCGSP